MLEMSSKCCLSRPARDQNYASRLRLVKVKYGNNTKNTASITSPFSLLQLALIYDTSECLCAVSMLPLNEFEKPCISLEFPLTFRNSPLS